MVGWYVERLMQRYFPRFHAIFCEVVYIVDHALVQHRVSHTICVPIVITIKNVINAESLLAIY